MRMSELARVEVEPGEEACVIRVRGEVDISNARRLLAAIEDALTNETPTLTLDLTDTTYLDSAGVQILFVLAERLKDRRHRLRLVVPESSPVRAVLELTGLPKLVQMETDPTAAEAIG
jgi:anti-anti-sigma factor